MQRLKARRSISAPTASQCQGRFADLGRLLGLAARALGDLADQAPQALHEAGSALDALIGPDHVAIRR